MIITRETMVENHNLDTLLNPQFNNFFYWMLDKYNCKYMTYLLEDLETDKVFYISTNPVWQEELIKSKIINECPIYKIANNLVTSGLAPIFWNVLRRNESKSDQHLNDYRAEFDVANGLGFVNNLGRFRENFCYATDKNDLDFAQRIVRNNIHISGLHMFRQLHNHEIINYQEIKCIQKK